MNPFSEQKNLGLLFARARKQTNVHVHFRERERERERERAENENEKLRTSKMLLERALPRCRDLSLDKVVDV